MDQLTATDIEFIGDSMFPGIDKEIISKMVAFNNTVGFSFSIVIIIIIMYILVSNPSCKIYCLSHGKFHYPDTFCFIGEELI